MHNLSRMQERVHSDPKGLISEFFLEVRRDLECEPEEPMSLNTWRKNQAWGKHTTLNRCTAMDIGVIKLLARSKNLDADGLSALAQAIQNVRAKMHAAFDDGSFDRAWLLTGLVDPCRKREFAAPVDQVAAVSGYISAMPTLKKNRSNNNPELEADGKKDAKAEKAAAKEAEVSRARRW